MTMIILLIVIALTLVFFEILLPGGILGLIAVICWLAATWLAFSGYGAIVGILVFLGTVVIGVIQVFIEFKLLEHTRMGKSFFLSGKIEHRHAPQATTDAIIGKTGESLTRLNPTGMVRIDGKNFEAHSNDGLIDPHQDVIVTAQDNFRLIVKKNKT
jgi:membrane-bound ClpP family serine protease